MILATCPQCDWTHKVITDIGVRQAWKTHKDDHVTRLMEQLETLGPDGFRMCGPCAVAEGDHRPCYHVDCACDCC